MLEPIEAEPAPTYIKTYGEGEMFGEGCFASQNPELKRLNSAIVISENNDTVLVKFNTLAVYEAIVVENRRWTLENKALFFHTNVVGLNA